MTKSEKKYNELMQGMMDLGAVIPQTLTSFNRMHKAIAKDETLSHQTKELIALGISIAIRCEGCIISHTKEALEHGATVGEIAETIGVSVMMGGAPSIVYGTKALKAMKEFLDGDKE
ncbi:MAG: carboxymuconolactone decarboxylase family protein [Chlamydiia bacterium]|nr:carboxymuconolactone decarboxylase family protein [Chlamydiia bacterium]